jgi:hypothetical protein
MKKPAETTKLQPIAPRLLDVQGSAFYLSVGVQTVRDWVDDVLLEPVRVPGAALREKGGRIVSRPGKRRMAKLLFDRDDLDDLSMNSNATEPGHEFARALARGSLLRGEWQAARIMWSANA